MADYIKYLSYLLYYGLPRAPQPAAVRPIHILPIILNYLYLQFFLIFSLTINPNPPCQLSLWEETGENQQLSAEC